MAESKVKMLLDGQPYEITVKEDETILEAALEADIDAPYSCMSGTCTACLANIKSGQIEMDECYALSEEEVSEGQILTCQAKCKTPLVEIEYP